jgi:hypothetical protein
MGCLTVGLPALLVLAVPAAIARSSLLGALIVLAAVAALAVAGALRFGRRRTVTRIGVAALAYAGVVVLINLTG